jgi:hypothetical protein
MNMEGHEGFGVPTEKMRPTSEPLEVLGHEEKIKQAEKMVREMFGTSMEAPGVITDRIKENPSFNNPSDRDF